MSEKLKDANFSTGAVRSADVDHLDFASMPLAGLLGAMKIAGGGGTKYGRFNFMKGMPVHVTLNHVAVHLIKYLLGDRSEDHLSKVAWGAMVANQTAALNPEMAEPHLLGPGATLTDAMLSEMERGKEERDRRRKAGEFEALFSGTLADVPEVKEILKIRGNKSLDNTAIEGRDREFLLMGEALNDTEEVVEPKPDPDESWVMPPRDIPGDWAPGSTNSKVYGVPTRVEPDQGSATPLPNEYWVVFDDGQRAYFDFRGNKRPFGGAKEETTANRIVRRSFKDEPGEKATCNHANWNFQLNCCRDCGADKRMIRLARTASHVPTDHVRNLLNKLDSQES